MDAPTLSPEVVELLKAAGATAGAAFGAALVAVWSGLRQRKQLEPFKGRLRQGAETFAELREGLRLVDERLRRLEGDRDATNPEEGESGGG